MDELERKLMEQRTLVYVMGFGLFFMSLLLIMSFYMIARLINE